MRKKLIVLLVLLGLGAFLFSNWDTPPSDQTVEKVWRTDIAAQHMEELMGLIGPQALDFIVFEDFEVKEIKRIGYGRYRASYRFKMRLRRPLDALAGPPVGSAMDLIRSFFPTGVTGATSTASGVLQLEETGTGWQSA